MAPPCCISIRPTTSTRSTAGSNSGSSNGGPRRCFPAKASSCSWCPFTPLPRAQVFSPATIRRSAPSGFLLLPSKRSGNASWSPKSGARRFPTIRSTRSASSAGRPTPARCLSCRSTRNPSFTYARSPWAWRLAEIPLDLHGLLSGFRPWYRAGFAGLNRSVSDLIGAKFPVAQPPRPAHIALALSVGTLNGKRLTPNRPGLPAVLAKGSFRRDFQTVEERFNQEGEKVGSIMVQRPKLTLSLLRLDTLEFLELKPGTNPSGATDLADFNSADLLEHYGESLGRLMREQFPALHDPANPAHRMELPAARARALRGPGQRHRDRVEAPRDRREPPGHRRGRHRQIHRGALDRGRAFSPLLPRDRYGASPPRLRYLPAFPGSADAHHLPAALVEVLAGPGRRRPSASPSEGRRADRRSPRGGRDLRALPRDCEARPRRFRRRRG